MVSSEASRWEGKGGPLSKIALISATCSRGKILVSSTKSDIAS